MTKLEVALSLVLTACTSLDPPSTRRAILEMPCSADPDCPAGFGCEIEVERGTTWTYCQAFEASDQCPAGYQFEVEIRHGQAFCRPSGDPTVPGSDDECEVDSDCRAGEECEVEHGVGFCKPHGGDN